MKKILSILAIATMTLVACNKEEQKVEVTLSLDKTAVTLNVGENLVLVPAVTPATTAVTFETSNPSVATVDNGGKVVAVAVGSANITAKAGDKTASCAVTVKTVTYSAVYTETFDTNPVRTAFNKGGAWAVFTLGHDAAMKAGLTWGYDDATAGWTGNPNSVYASSYWGPAFNSEAWFVSPSIDLTGAKYAKMTFKECMAYGNPVDYTVWACVDQGIQDLGSDPAIWWGGPVDVAPNGTWGQVVVPNHANMDGTYTFIESGDVDLNDYAGEKIRVAFKYIGTTAQAGTWNIDDVVVFKGE